jgi:hypothetical protein
VTLLRGEPLDAHPQLGDRIEHTFILRTPCDKKEVPPGEPVDRRTSDFCAVREPTDDDDVA